MIRLIKKLKKRKIIKPGKIDQFSGSGNFIHTTALLNNPEHIRMGKNCWIGGFTCLYANPPGMEIGNNVIIADHVTILNNFHHYENAALIPFDYKSVARPVFIGNNVWIGMNVLILPGVKIEEGAVIGAGSVVTKSVPKCAIVAGNPAKIVRYRDKAHYEQLVKNKKYFDIYSNHTPEMIIEDKFNDFMKG